MDPRTRREGGTPALVARRAPDARALAIVLLLCLIWGFQQTVMKWIGAEVPPVLQLALRFSCAGLFFATLVLVREGPSPPGLGSLPSGLLLGTLFSLEFLLVGQSLLHTTAAHCIVFLYTAPIFTALGLRVMPDERLDAAQWLGIAIAFAGVVAAFWGASDHGWQETLTGDALALLAGASWGLSNVVLRRGRISAASTARTVLYQVGLAGPLLLAFAAASGQLHLVPTAAAIGVLLFQTLVISIASYLLWFWLLRHYLASRLMLMTLLTPLVGVVSSALLLHEPIEPRFALGALLVLAGILAVNRPRARA